MPNRAADGRAREVYSASPEVTMRSDGSFPCCAVACSLGIGALAPHARLAEHEASELEA